MFWLTLICFRIFPRTNAFRSQEELIRTLYHEKVHVEQFRTYGVSFVQENREHFEDLAYRAEDAFIFALKGEGVLK